MESSADELVFESVSKTKNDISFAIMHLRKSVLLLKEAHHDTETTFIDTFNLEFKNINTILDEFDKKLHVYSKMILKLEKECHSKMKIVESKCDRQLHFYKLKYTSLLNELNKKFEFNLKIDELSKPNIPMIFLLNCVVNLFIVVLYNVFFW